jgi:hypothetical protein
MARLLLLIIIAVTIAISAAAQAQKRTLASGKVAPPEEGLVAAPRTPVHREELATLPPTLRPRAAAPSSSLQRQLERFMLEREIKQFLDTASQPGARPPGEAAHPLSNERLSRTFRADR